MNKQDTHMQHYDYRIVRFQQEHSESFKVLPVAYDKNGEPVALISDQVILHHVSVQHLLHSMTHMMAAFSKPVLSAEQIHPQSPKHTTDQAFDILSKKHV
jgi:hypothetical protein